MNKSLIIKIAVTVSYLAMVTVNALSNILPINNVTAREVSDSFPNLFAPAGLTFSIWGLIYLLLAGYIFYQLFNKKDVLDKINIYFIISSLANIAWIFAWHYKIIWASLLLILVILACLVKIADVIRKEKMTLKENVLIRWPFSVYFGWITVAVIANVTVLLVSLNWDGFGVAEYIWTAAILLIGAGIGIKRMLKDRNIPYGLVFIWAYFGIWLKHTSETGFNLQYPSVVFTTILSVILFLAGILHILKTSQD